MNKQKGSVIWNSDHTEILKVQGGIEWTITWIYNELGQRIGVKFGATSNPVGGCFHACRWKMPNGEIAICYAETTAEGVAGSAYPHGFEYLYWRPEELLKWDRAPRGFKIFPDSMSDLWGHWVDHDKKRAVMEAMTRNPGLTFLGLTKAPLQMLKYQAEEEKNSEQASLSPVYIPDNYWPGVSTPPDFFMGKELTPVQKAKKFRSDLECLIVLKANGYKWLSIEPLSWDISQILAQYIHEIDWLVIGAASNGKTYYQPNPLYLDKILTLADEEHVPVFFKGNLDYTPWRGDFPGEGNYI